MARRTPIIIVVLIAAAALGIGLGQLGGLLDSRPSGHELARRVEAAPALGVAPSPRQQSSQPSGITVAGEGMVRAMPDVAYVTAGVQNTAATAQQAQQENATLMNAVIAKLESMGFEQKDLRTTGLSIHPLYENQTSPTSYRANNQVVVTVGDIGRAGAIFDAMVGAGANVAADIRFGLKDDASLRLQALREAVKAARAKAEAIADEMGVKITSVESVTEESAGGPQVEPLAIPAAAVEAPTPVIPGTITITSRVSATYRY